MNDRNGLHGPYKYKQFLYLIIQYLVLLLHFFNSKQMNEVNFFLVVRVNERLVKYRKLR